MGRRATDSADDSREPADVFVLTELEQVKVLADPLRIRILEALCAGEHTTKQVAEELGEKPTRLYHHVEALERVGLIRLSRTAQNRGTVEKYYSAVARKFQAGSGLFSTEGPEDEERTETISRMVGTVLGNTAEELQRLIEAGHDISEEGDSAIISYLELQAGEDEIAALRERLISLLKEFEQICLSTPDDDEGRKYRLTVACFPLDRFDEPGE